MVVEIRSPDDETWHKLPFYAAHHVDEVLIIDPAQQTVTWLGRRDNEYEPIGHSALIELGPTELAAQLDWPWCRWAPRPVGREGSAGPLVVPAEHEVGNPGTSVTGRHCVVLATRLRLLIDGGGL